MTIEEYKKHIENDDMPRNWIGQGWGYKDLSFDWDKGNSTDIIYIPEHGYPELDLGFDEYDGYSKNDFIQICDGNETEANALFYSVDWQFPETLYDEWCRDEVI